MPRHTCVASSAFIGALVLQSDRTPFVRTRTQTNPAPDGKHVHEPQYQNGTRSVWALAAAPEAAEQSDDADTTTAKSDEATSIQEARMPTRGTSKLWEKAEEMRQSAWLDQVVTCYDTAVNACDIPNQSQVTQSQSPTTNHLSAQAHLCSLQRLHWRSCATVGQGSFRPNADANESGAKSVRLKRKTNKPNQINQQLQSWRPMRAS